MVKNKAKIIIQRDQLISQIKEYCPILGDFFKMNKNLNDYSHSINEFKKNIIYFERQKELVPRVLKMVVKIFGHEVANKLNIKFSDQLALNIVDHHQVLNHPLLISDNIVSSTDKFFKNEKQPATLVFSSGDVPPNNYFSKNGFMLHGKKVPLFSNSEKESTSYYLPKRQFDFITRLQAQKRWDDFTVEEKYFLEKINKLIVGLDFSHCENYNEQVTLIVNKSWPLMFEKKLRSNLSELIYIPQEEITRSSLLDLLKGNNFITQTLFDHKFRQLVLEKFRGIVVTWREDVGKGTHFFWRKHPTQSKSLRLFMQNNKLVPFDEKYKDLAIDLEQDQIIELLEKREIYPSLFLIFAVNIFYYGIKPLAGHGSLTYLNLIKDAWLKVLPFSDFKEEVNNFQTIKIDYLITGISLFFKYINGQYMDMYAHDVMFDGGIKQVQLEKLFRMSYKDLLSINVNEIYNYVQQKYVPESEKIKPQFINADYASLIYEDS